MSSLDIDYNNIESAGYDYSESYNSLSITGQLYKPGVSFPTMDFDFFEHQVPMVVRFLPLFNNGVPIPSVVESHGEFQITPWLMRLPVVTCGTQSKTMFILFNPHEERNKRYDAATNPYVILRRKIRQAAGKNSTQLDLTTGLPCKQVWSYLVSDDQAAMPNWKDTFFAQGLGYSDGKKFTVETRDGGIIRPMGARTQDKRLVMFRLSKTAGEAVASSVITLAKQGIMAVNAKTPIFYGIYNADRGGKVDVDALAYQEYQASLSQQVGAGGGGMMMDTRAFAAQGAGGSAKSGDTKAQFSSYGITPTKIARIRQVDPPAEVILDSDKCDLEADGCLIDVLNRYTPLGQIFEIMSDVDQAITIAKAFSDVPQVLQFGWADTPYLAIPAVQEIINSKTASVHPSIGDQSRFGGGGGAGGAGTAGFGGAGGGGFGGGGGNNLNAAMSGSGFAVNNNPTVGAAGFASAGNTAPLNNTFQANAGVKSVIGKVDFEDDDS